MKKDSTKRKPLLALLVCLLVAALFMGLAAGMERGFGGVRVEYGVLPVEGGVVGYKIYIPKSASAENPVPAVLLAHGYQNDNETSDALAIELARRGVVVLSIDIYGHGRTTIPMRARGWAEATLADPGTPLKGLDHYKMLMTLSNLDFFDSPASDGLQDTAMGGYEAYDYLAALPCVDAAQMGLAGHSLGTFVAWSVAARNPEHRAVVLECVELFPDALYDSGNIRFNNVLAVHARYDEYNSAEKRGIVPDSPLFYSDFMGESEPAETGKTYGAFSDGSARRVEVLNTTHRLTTHDSAGVTRSVEWLCAALGVSPAVSAAHHVYWWKEVFVLIAMLAALASLMPLAALLLRLPFFAKAAQPLPDDTTKMLPRGKWWRTAIIAILISAVTYPFLTIIGHAILPLPESVFRMPIGNSYLLWLLVLAMIAFFMVQRWIRRGAGSKMEISLYELGLSDTDHKKKMGWGALGRSTLLAVILTAFLYLLAQISVWTTGLDFHFL